MGNMEVSIFPGGSKGYGAAGASVTRRSTKGFNAQSGSPREDIDSNNGTMRQRCRMLYMSAPPGTSGIKTNRTNTIGLGLKLNPKIDWEYLGITAEQAEQWEKDVKKEFAIWAERKDACDATGMNGFYEIQQLAFLSWLMSGDVLVLLKHEGTDKNHPYSLRLHVVEADRCSTPQDNASYLFNMTEGEAGNGNRIYDGVEVDSAGKVVAYHIRNTYPYQATLEKTQWARVEAYGRETGLPNVVHVMNSERPEQYRGVSYLAQIIEPILQMRRYTEAEITAAIIESFLTGFVQTDSNTEKLPFNDTAPEGEEETLYDPNEYRLGPGQMNVMNPGEKIVFAEPKRPASGHEAFVKSMCTQIGAALEIPRDLLMKEFGASYSASRGALLEAFKSFQMYRGWFTSDFCSPIYEVWLSEAVAIGRISAPGFFGDRRTKEAWLGAEWVGPSQGQLDPMKEITSEILSVSEGFSTHAASTVRMNGGDWNANMDKLRTEMEKKQGILGGNRNVPAQEDAHPGNDRGEDERGNAAMQGWAQRLIMCAIRDAVKDAIEEERGINQ